VRFTECLFINTWKEVLAQQGFAVPQIEAVIADLRIRVTNLVKGFL